MNNIYIAIHWQYKCIIELINKKKNIIPERPDDEAGTPVQKSI